MWSLLTCSNCLYSNILPTVAVWFHHYVVFYVLFCLILYHYTDYTYVVLYLQNWFSDNRISAYLFVATLLHVCKHLVTTLK